MKSNAVPRNAVTASRESTTTSASRGEECVTPPESRSAVKHGTPRARDVGHPWMAGDSGKARHRSRACTACRRRQRREPDQAGQDGPASGGRSGNTGKKGIKTKPWSQTDHNHLAPPGDDPGGGEGAEGRAPDALRARPGGFAYLTSSRRGPMRPRRPRAARSPGVAPP
jgi:hypothetical protein